MCISDLIIFAQPIKMASSLKIGRVVKSAMRVIKNNRTIAKKRKLMEGLLFIIVIHLIEDIKKNYR
ncbi:MAG: hypothetical protein QF907_03540 [Nitrospinota bacterium]|nr:hypothetical protein [Nitrospinota bacterium]MDP7581142.1 hypothetical protein [Nitrospinota bacterium]HJN02765.1 hypothetical protein [Nitrospinota bacterium]